MRSLIRLLLLVPLACNFEGPLGPPRTATTDLRVAAGPDLSRAFLGYTFVIPNAGAAIAPEFAGQTVGVMFLSGRTPFARVSVGGATFETALTFAPCEFRVIEVPIPNRTGIRVGHTFTVSPCDLVVGTSGLVTKRSGEPRLAQLIFGTASSTSALFTVRVERDGGVFVFGLTWTRVGTVAMSEGE